EEVTVITDSNGVPHIKAANNHDLFIAQGYMQAQNRMFQMEMSRRQASGTLSEIVGEKAINTDKYFRTLGLRRAAEKSYAIYSEESKEVLQYFSDGVNAYIHEAIESNSLPIEFTLMGAKPADWTPLDSLTIGKYMAFDLGGHWERQAFNYYLLGEFDDEKAMELFPHYPEEKPTIIKYGEVDIASSFENAIIPNTFNGSNNWVVSG
ncbi:penicillin acylase family protein, partial [Virgibacillus halodenitrificans]|nr:penicillin acylase family protein [Virgibacillus halodenitrificans]